MRILIDINHPAHVHYFRNFIKLMEAKGHQFCVINRNSKMINQLLDYYGIEHTIRNKRPVKKGTIASLMNLVRMTGWCIRKSFSYHPDMYIGFASSACAISSWLFRKPCILIDDTEHNVMNHKMYLPFCDLVFTPFYFFKQLGNGNKQKKINAYVEQLYLHSSYYNSDTAILRELNTNPKEYVLFRFIAYDAHHDLVARPLPEEIKKRMVRMVARRFRVFISLEKDNKDPFYNDYRLSISPEKMHDLMANARCLVTEGATMASEAFVLGVPSLYLNPLRCGNIDYQCKHKPNRSFQTTDEEEAEAILSRMLALDYNYESERLILEKETINPTNYLIEEIEKYIVEV